jgi:chromosome segregation ATPase
MPASDELIAESIPESSAAESETSVDDVDSLETRLTAVERTLTDGDTPVAKLEEAERVHQRLAAVEQTLEDLTERVSELEAASRALRGYAGGIQTVNEDIERRADLALAKAETIERSLSDEPGLQIERLDSAISEQVDEVTENASSADDSTEDAESAPESGHSADRPDRSLSERIRDVL